MKASEIIILSWKNQEAVNANSKNSVHLFVWSLFLVTYEQIGGKCGHYEQLCLVCSVIRLNS